MYYKVEFTDAVIKQLEAEGVTTEARNRLADYFNTVSPDAVETFIPNFEGKDISYSRDDKRKTITIMTTEEGRQLEYDSRRTG